MRVTKDYKHQVYQKFLKAMENIGHRAIDADENEFESPLDLARGVIQHMEDGYIVGHKLDSKEQGPIFIGSWDK